jgi:rhodanese-related sulfurtransferase
MHRFKSGQFEGMTMEHAILRKAPAFYGMMAWAKDKPRLSHLVAKFERLRDKLREAPIVVHCAHLGCKRQPTRMTLPLGYDNYYWPDPDFWCRKHEPWEDERNSGKMRISLDVIDSFEEKKNRVAVHRAVLIALGIKSRSKVAEKYARNFFANLD